jgi:hypothetical protein
MKKFDGFERSTLWLSMTPWKKKIRVDLKFFGEGNTYLSLTIKAIA